MTATPNNHDNTIDETSIRQMLPLRMKSIVVRGFGRGSTDLGVPTANLCSNEENCFSWSVPQQRSPTLDDLPTGIYWGYGRIANDPIYVSAISIGYNPTYNNTIKTIEPHFIAPDHDPRRHASSCGETILNEFYDETIRLSVCGYLRPELPFEGLDKLTLAIKKDIENAVEMGKNSNNDDIITKEYEWVQSSLAVEGR